MLNVVKRWLAPPVFARERVGFERLTSEITEKLRQASNLEVLVKVASEAKEFPGVPAGR